MSGDHHELTCAIRELSFAVRDYLQEQKMQFQWMVGHRQFATKQDIETLSESISMKIPEAKVALQTASRQQKEAIAEIGTQLADLNVQIQELKTASTDPNVSDEDFNSLVATLQADAKALADLVPGTPSTDTPAPTA